MDALRQIIAHFGIEVDTKQVEKGDTLVDHLIGKLGHFGHAVAGVFAFHQIEAFVEATVNEARELAKSAVVAGMAADELQRLQHAANMADVSAGSLGSGLKFLQRNAYAASEGSAEAVAAFKAFGIELKKGEKIDTTDLLYRTADAIAALDDPAKQTAMAIKVFGRGGIEMLPMLKKGSEGIRQYAEELDHLGGGFSEEFLERSEQFEDKQKELAMVWKGLRGQIVNELIPGLLEWGEKLKKLGLKVKDLNKDGSLMRVVWAGAIWAIAVKLPALISLMKGFAASTLLPMAGLVLMALAAEDLLTWFQGGDSVIGRFFGLFDEGINTTAANMFTQLGVMFSSWDNFFLGVLRGWAYLKAGVQIVMFEISAGVVQVIANLADALVDILSLPIRLIQKAMGFKEIASNFGLADKARETSAEKRQGLGQSIGEDLSTDDTITELLKLRRDAKERDAWQASGGRMGTTDNGPGGSWDMLAGAPRQAELPLLPPSSIARTEITDNSKTEVKVDVHGMDPATGVKKVGAAVAKAAKTDYHGAGMALEHTVD